MKNHLQDKIAFFSQLNSIFGPFDNIILRTFLRAYVVEINPFHFFITTENSFIFRSLDLRALYRVPIDTYPSRRYFYPLIDFEDIYI